jgi:flagellar hook assembly protein FlgD
MNRTYLLLASLAITCMLAIQPAFSQNKSKHSSSLTEGALTFTVKTISYGSGYSPKHVLSIWIKDSLGNFVVSNKVMAASRKKHLVKWVASSNNNVTTAITGATLPNHQTHSINWDGKNANGQMMQDGLYQVWVEYTSQNSATSSPAGPYMSVQFHKGPISDHQAPQNQTYFENILLDWIPSGVGLDENSRSFENISVYPNPFRNSTSVKITLKKPSQVQVVIYDSSGKLVNDLISESCSSGAYSFTWDGTNNEGNLLANGLYILNVIVNGMPFNQKLMLER